MPWPWAKKAAPAAPAPISAPAEMHSVNFFVKIVDGNIGGTVRVTMSPPHKFVPPALDVAIQQAAASVFAPATVDTIEVVASRSDWDLYKSATSRFKGAEGRDAPGFQIVKVVIERKQLGSDPNNG